MLSSLLAALVSSPQPSTPAPRDPWAEMALRDLKVIRQRLAEGHPAPAEGTNKVFNAQLNAGYMQAKKQGEGARSYFDYRRTLLSYVNGFRDGHIALTFQLGGSQLWPGFKIVREKNGEFRVAAAEPDANIAVGDRIVGCNGRSAEELIKSDIDPYYYNPEIPHLRDILAARLFVAQRGSGYPTRCEVRRGGSIQDVDLKWREADSTTVDRLLYGRDPLPSFSLKQVNGTWFITLPTFALGTAEQTEGMRSLIEEVRLRAPELRRTNLVLDVRGNGGGNSSWGNRIVDAVWGDGWAKHIQSQFDMTTDWRVAQVNIEGLDSNVKFGQAAGQQNVVASNTRLRDEMSAALSRGEPFLRRGGPPQPTPRPNNPVTGSVYLLTDQRCFSACLDFADVVRRLPNVTHVGEPTSADTRYMENTNILLPSGLVRFGHPMKLIRNRTRANNEWYAPQVQWPGGEMSDGAIAEWVTRLSQTRSR